jgi:hypothetical protein
LTGCPLEYITPDIDELLMLADFYEKGLPPIAGGVLDQAAGFVEACHIIFAEKAHWKRKFKLDG